MVTVSIQASRRWYASALELAGKAVVIACAPFMSEPAMDRLIDRLASAYVNAALRFKVVCA
jgi:hypothetical protein